MRGVIRGEACQFARHRALLVSVGYGLAALGRRLTAIQQLNSRLESELLQTLLLGDIRSGT